MVIKTCKICGKEFDARRSAKCCTPKCSKENERRRRKKYYEDNRDEIFERNKEYRQSDKYKENKKEYQRKYRQSDKGKATQKRYQQSDKGKATQKRYQQSDKYKEYQKEYRQSDKYKEYQKEYRQSDKYKEYQKEYTQNKIAELNEEYDGDLHLILKDCPYRWMEREAIMVVEYGVSYVDAMYKKMELNPVCEVTGESGDLVIHHLDSFNAHPEKGADLDNLVRVKKEIHDEFHNIYGRGNNTREQWFEFVKKMRI